MSKDVEDKKHCKDCHYYEQPKCTHKEVDTYTARKNSCAYHVVYNTIKKGNAKKGK